MKLLSYNNSIEVNLSYGVNSIVFENKKQFREFIQECIEQTNGDNGDVIISNENEDINFKKNVNIITDLFNLNLNKAEFIKIIINDIVETIQDEKNYSYFIKLRDNLSEFLDEMLDDYMLELDYDHNNDISKILKLKNIKIYGDREKLVDKLLIYLNAANKLLGISLFIIVNLTSFYTGDELKIINDECQYNDIVLINIDHYNSNCYVKCAIDNDLCRYI